MSKGCDNTKYDRTMLLLLHGFLDFWYIWNHQIPELGEEFCVVVPDLRGYGDTTKPANTSTYLMKHLVEDVRLLIDKLNSDKQRKVVLIGHDWGGMIGFVFATLNEKMIEGLIIINGMHPLAFARRLLESVTQMKMSWYFLPFRHEDVPEKYLIMRDFTFFDKVHRGFTPDEENSHKYMFSQNGSLTGALSYYRAFNEDSDQLKKFDYRKINVSALILWAEEDAFLTTPIATYNQVWLKSSKIVYYAKAGHWVLRECSKEVTERISTFVKSIGGTSKPSSNYAVKERTSNDLCEESNTPRKSWISTVFAWLPRNVSIPTLVAE
ncbi:epoxide hydrolase 4-like isoform X1 [Dermacentor silvarum]|uniref:epoxide hydrolase 4-like isoform X1 n=2 Tax=Dermacentor silvarum TaxID=543639 RepID=UPI002101827C|nr:epoxide hydrolase 4-like isoform X1 [Dermacentor silvarum]